MIQKFTIPARLPGLNEIIEANRTNRYEGAKQKEIADMLVAFHAKRIKPLESPCVVKIRFIEPNKKRDIDNIYSGAKFVLDGLRKAGILKNDSQKWVVDLKCEIGFDKDARVEVEIDDMDIL